MGFGIWPQFSVNGTLIEASIFDHTKIDQEFVEDVSKLCQTCILLTVHLALSEIRKSDFHHRLTSMIREQNVSSVCYNILVLFKSESCKKKLFDSNLHRENGIFC